MCKFSDYNIQEQSTFLECINSVFFCSFPSVLAVQTAFVQQKSELQKWLIEVSNTWMIVRCYNI